MPPDPNEPDVPFRRRTDTIPDDETPTDPDLAVHPCPHCGGTGHVTGATLKAYKSEHPKRPTPLIPPK